MILAASRITHTLGLVIGLFIFTISTASAHHRHHWRHHHHRHVVRVHSIVQGLGHGLAHMLESIGNTHGMNTNFVEKLKAAFADNPFHCRIGSGYRSHAEQAALHRAKPRLAAAPGHSNHERGLAADLSCASAGLRWMHAHAAKYGLRFPMSYEAWHIEPVGATRIAMRHRRHYARRTHYAAAH